MVLHSINGWACIAAGLLLGMGMHASSSRAADTPSPPETLQSDNRLGEVRVFAPQEPPKALVFLLSDGDGWGKDEDQAAAALQANDILVTGIDTKATLARAEEGEHDCVYLVSDLEALSKLVQRSRNLDSYMTPILAGVGTGGAVAYASLAQAPAATIEGAVSVDPSSGFVTTLPFCPGAPAAPLAQGGFSYGKVDHLPGWWSVTVEVGKCHLWLGQGSRGGRPARGPARQPALRDPGRTRSQGGDRERLARGSAHRRTAG